jgi:hypothetical protein
LPAWRLITDVPEVHLTDMPSDTFVSNDSYCFICLLFAEYMVTQIKQKCSVLPQTT